MILGIDALWRIATVRLDAKASNVHVKLEHQKGIRWKCPCCIQKLPVNGHLAERQRRHLDTCPYDTWVQARIPRVNCPKHAVRRQLVRLFSDN